MEDALVRWQKVRLVRRTPTVLILVLMEDALVQVYYEVVR